MEAQAIFDALKGKFGDAVVELQGEGFSPAFVVVVPAAFSRSVIGPALRYPWRDTALDVAHDV